LFKIKLLHVQNYFVRSLSAGHVRWRGAGGVISSKNTYYLAFFGLKTEDLGILFSAKRLAFTIKNSHFPGILSMENSRNLQKTFQKLLPGGGGW
jgi:hypothetical protein